MDRILVTAGVHRPIEIDDNFQKLPLEMDRMSVRQPAEVNIGVRAMRLPGETDGRFKQRMETNAHRAPSWLNPAAYYSTHNSPSSSVLHTQDQSQPFPLTSDHAKGHAHDPLEDTLFLSIGSSSADPLSGGADLPDLPQPDPLFPVVSESPSAVDMNIYEQAYQDEMKRILERRGRRDQSIYLTRRVEHREDSVRARVFFDFLAQPRVVIVVPFGQVFGDEVRLGAVLVVERFLRDAGAFGDVADRRGGEPVAQGQLDGGVVNAPECLGALLFTRAGRSFLH